ncbi:MAG: 5-formyltetrahydrofolate cyclo-ligase [Legionella sp.]
MPNMIKIALRNTIKQVRSKMSQSYRSQSSTHICNRIRLLDIYVNAKHIALYQAANGEVELNSIWKSAPHHGKTCYFPVLKEDLSLLFVPAKPETTFHKNRYGILEPDVPHDQAINPNDLDLVFMPLVAFDAKCTRIGMGAGYYDRTFANVRNCHLFGVAYQFQRVDFIDPQSWDIPLDAVVTNRAIYWRSTAL